MPPVSGTVWLSVSRAEGDTFFHADKPDCSPRVPRKMLVVWETPLNGSYTP